MKTVMCAAALSLLVCACSNTTYTYARPGGSDQSLQEDLSECKGVMAREVGDDAKDAMDKCMVDKGYEKVVDKYRL